MGDLLGECLGPPTLETTVVVVTHKIPSVFNVTYRHLTIDEYGAIYEVH